MDFKKLLYYAFRSPLEKETDRQWREEWSQDKNLRISKLERKKKEIQKKDLPNDFKEDYLSDIDSLLRQEKNKQHSEYETRKEAEFMFSEQGRKNYLSRSDQIIKRLHKIEKKQRKEIKNTPLLGDLIELYQSEMEYFKNSNKISGSWSFLIDIEIFIRCLKNKKFSVLKVLGKEKTIDILEEIEGSKKLNRVEIEEKYFSQL